MLLIDADMHRPQIHRVFDLAVSPGLANILSGETKPSAALLKSEVNGLFVLPAGAGVLSPSDLLDSERLIALIDGFRKGLRYRRARLPTGDGSCRRVNHGKRGVVGAVRRRCGRVNP